MTTRSEKTALEFYERLGPAGIAELTTPDADAEVIAQITTRLAPASRVLDLGCGYGRIALPLVRGGYHVVALDLCQNLISQGRHDAREASLAISWLRATMRSIPIVAGFFDAVLCLWTAFFQLIDPPEQISALSEVLRVLSPGGWALFEGPPYRKPTPEEISSGQRCGPGNRIFRFRVADAENWLYCHDESSLRHVSRAAGIERPIVHVRPWGGRERLLLEFSKPTSHAAA